jgi:hypothetical protein
LVDCEGIAVFLMQLVVVCADAYGVVCNRRLVEQFKVGVSSVPMPQILIVAVIDLDRSVSSNS